MCERLLLLFCITLYNFSVSRQGRSVGRAKSVGRQLRADRERSGKTTEGPEEMQRTTPSARHRIEVPRTAAELRRFGTVLFDQQMWCWGRDVLRAGGNALCLYGLERCPPPPNLKACSCYRFTGQKGEHLVLWGFGLFYGEEDGGLFLRRYDLSPVWLRVSKLPEGVWGPEALAPFQRQDEPQDQRAWLRLLSASLRWMAGYERWAQERLGPEYREECVAQWHKEGVPAADMAGAWDGLAQSIVVAWPGYGRGKSFGSS
jgi:hypothetical protein